MVVAVNTCRVTNTICEVQKYLTCYAHCYGITRVLVRGNQDWHCFKLKPLSLWHTAVVTMDTASLPQLLHTFGVQELLRKSQTPIDEQE